jgi:acetate kinase
VSGERVLVVNAGSTSLKLSVVADDGSVETVASIADAPDDVLGVAHRVVHGGSRFRGPVVIDDAVEKELHALSELAPLHNRSAVAAIDDARRALPAITHVAIFDTAFHSTIPDEASTFAIPKRWRDEWGIRRFGFHGLSVQWAAENVPVERLVVCHLGGGCSVTAVRAGRSIDTTMGYSPLDGVPMATRSGSIDPGALLYVLRSELLSLEELARDLEHASGLAGLSGGGDGDMRKASPLAVDVFVHRVVGAVAAMAAACGGLDILAFSGGIGEHARDVRERIVDGVRFLGDFRVEVVTAREELVIAAETRRVLGA